MVLAVALRKLKHNTFISHINILHSIWYDSAVWDSSPCCNVYRCNKAWVRGDLMKAHLAVLRLLPLYLGVWWVCLDPSQQRVVEGLRSAHKQNQHRQTGSVSYFILQLTSLIIKDWVGNYVRSCLFTWLMLVSSILTAPVAPDRRHAEARWASFDISDAPTVTLFLNISSCDCSIKGISRFHCNIIQFPLSHIWNHIPYV